MTGKQTSLTTPAQSNRTPATRQTEELHAADHEQNDNWEWSDEFTEFINSHVTGFSLKVCPGLRPICDVNLDIENLHSVADSDAAEFTVTDLAETNRIDARLSTVYNALDSDASRDDVYGRITPAPDTDLADLYDGYACTGDMFSLPFDENTFDTVVADPPWLDLSQEERRALFDEIVRVTKATGVILYNATWIPTHEHTRQYDLRMRQQLDFWGGPSFAACYRRTATDIHELFDAQNYDSAERYPDDSPFWSEEFEPGAISRDHNTDPKLVAPDGDHAEYCCPMCGCTRLDQLRDPFFETETGDYDTYECWDCGFRVSKHEVETLAAELTAAAARRSIPVNEVESIPYTPPSVERVLDDPDLQAGKHGDAEDSTVLSPALPWVPNPDTPSTTAVATPVRADGGTVMAAGERHVAAAQTSTTPRTQTDTDTIQQRLATYDKSNE